MNYKQWHSLPKCQAGDFYRYPRTMTEAFPQDINYDLHIDYAPMQRSEKVFCWVLVAIAAVVVALFIMGVIQ
jgi:t-SNARE complex subunit (syntaxin)